MGTEPKNVASERELRATTSGSPARLARTILQILRLQPGDPDVLVGTAMSDALEELVGHVDRLQRSLLFTHFRLEQGPISFIYRPSAPRVSRHQIDVFIAKRVCLLSSTGIGRTGSGAPSV